MSTYRRQGHWRRGPNGQQVWVQSHEVTRSSSSTYSYDPAPRPTTRVTIRNTAVPTPTGPRPKSAQWAEPNAKCPVCGAAVYFYKNEAGSRVYFDELGPPWPKHPCINIPFFTRPSVDLQGPPVMPSLRKPSVRGRKTVGSTPQRLDDRAHPGSSDAYQAFTVRVSEAGKDKTLLHLSPVSENGNGRICYVSGRIVPEPGQLVFISGLSISYFDVAQLSIIQLSTNAIAESASVPAPRRRDTVPTPLTLREDSAPTMPRQDLVPAPPPQDSARASVRKEGEGREETDPQESAGCGFSLLLFFLIILLWLVFGFWPGGHSFFGVLGGLVMTLITALGFTLGFTMLVNAKKEAAQDMRYGSPDRPKHLPGTPTDLGNSYSLFREE